MSNPGPSSALGALAANQRQERAPASPVTFAPEPPTSPPRPRCEDGALQGVRRSSRSVEFARHPEAAAWSLRPGVGSPSVREREKRPGVQALAAAPPSCMLDCQGVPGADSGVCHLHSGWRPDFPALGPRVLLSGHLSPLACLAPPRFLLGLGSFL